MKTILTIILFLLTLSSFSQKKYIKTFLFNDIEVKYTRVDYSKYGIAQFFVTMYNKNTENNEIEKRSISCLKSRSNIYHTLYFFLEIPSEINNEYQKTELFTEFMKHLKDEEKIKKFNLYLNFDNNYSIPYQLNENNVARITTNITTKKICRSLTIR